MVLIIFSILMVFCLLVIIRSYGTITQKEREIEETKEKIEKADTYVEELELLKRYCQIIESCHNLGVITDEEYREEQCYLNGKITQLENCVKEEESYE